MHLPWLLVLALAGAASPALPAPGVPDATLDRLLAQAAQRNPEVLQARAAVEAERRRVPQAGALPDPVLSLGMQNDGFDRIAIGEMETSFLSFGVSQTFPWPGKRGKREQVASLDLRKAEAALDRATLTLEAQVRGAFVDLLLAREELALIGELEHLWQQAQAAARVRYEGGQAPQSDLLRAQLESARLGQRRALQEARVANAVAALNRLAGDPLDAPIATSAHLGGSDPQLASEQESLRDAESRSPELLSARLAAAQSSAAVELARKEWWPDVSVQAAVMERGSLPPMWQVGLSVPIPLWGGRKQGNLVAENEQRAAASVQSAEAVRQVLVLRTRERLSLLGATIEVNRRYREGLLALSEATTRSTLSQYQVGRVPFNAVLEALGSFVEDRLSYLQSSAEAQRIAIAQRALTLDPLGGGAATAVSAPMPGTSTGAAAPARGATTQAQPAAQPSAMRGM